MQAYELMSLLSRAKAGQDMRVLIRLSLKELMSGEKMDEDTLLLSFTMILFVIFIAAALRAND